MASPEFQYPHTGSTQYEGATSDEEHQWLHVGEEPLVHRSNTSCMVSERVPGLQYGFQWLLS